MKKEFKICTVVQGKNLEYFLKNLKKAQVSAEMIELRADSVSDFTGKDLATLKKLVKLPAIFTFRHKKEGGLFTGTVKKQKNILKKAFELGFTYIDVAYDNALIKDLSAKEKKQLLLSYHHYEGTPPLKNLLELVNDMRANRPAAIKIATFVTHLDDIPVLSSLLKKRKKNEKFILIGMGKKGETTRLAFPAMGSHIAFVAMKGDKKIAPGMLTAEDFKNNFSK